MIWHHETPDAVARELQTNTEYGLSQAEATDRLEEYGHNRYREKKATPVFSLWMKQLRSLPMALILIAALVLLCLNIMLLYFKVSENPWILVEPIVMLLVPVFGHLAGALWQKHGTAKLHSITNAQTTTVTVLRDGNTCEISAAEVVRGDILFLEAGMIIPADCRLITAEDLACDEYILTGEDMDVEKSAEGILDGITPMMDRTNMVYAGCGVSRGSATAVVVSTGQSTEYALMLNDPHHQDSPLPDLSKDIHSFEKLVTLPILVLSVVILIIAVVKHLTGFADVVSVIPAVLTLAAACIPTGITAAAVVSMAIGMHHVVKDIADVRDLAVMDTLSRVTVICADKTGTLTTDKKQPVSVFTGDTELLSRMPSNRAQMLIRLATLCTAADTQKIGVNRELLQNPTESAIIEYARDIGIERRVLMEDSPRLAEIPFDPARRCMSVVHLVAGRRLMITMGAPEVVLSYCTGGALEGAQEAYQNMANQALRVLAVAYRHLDNNGTDTIDPSLECDMTLAGLIALADHARGESVKAIEECAKGGITTVMVTGDNEATAEAVALELGILKDASQLITGDQLAEMSHEEFDKSVGLYRVYARITPEQKERIIRAWQKRGAVVAATGSGLADVPALQRADIGCATGAADCDMTRNESDVTMYDNSFATLVETIQHARGIYTNIRKSLQYILTCAVALFVATFFTLIGSQSTFLLSSSAMALYMVLGVIGIFAIAYEAGDTHALTQKPQRGLYRLMPSGAWLELLWQGALTGICAFLAFDMGCSGASSSEEAPLWGMTTAFLTLMLSRLWILLTTHRHEKRRYFGNSMMLPVFLISLALTLIPLTVPAVRSAFGMTGVGARNWILGIILSAIPAVTIVVIRFVTKTILASRRRDRKAL